MAQQEKNPSDFMNQMLDMQQEYMKNLVQAFNPQQVAATPTNPFDMWWSQFPKSGQTEFDDFFKNLSKTGQRFMQNPFNLEQNPMATASDLTSWINQLNQQFSAWSGMAPSSNPVFDTINQQFIRQLQTPFAMPFMPGMPNQLSAFNSANYVDTPVLKLLQNLFNNEEKKAGEQLIKSLEIYQNLMLELNHMMAQVGIDSLTELQKKLDGTESLEYEKVYEWWMEISQGIFNKLQLGDEFKKLQDNMKKTENQLKQDMDTYRAGLAKNLGLVSRSEYETLKSELDKLKKEIKKAK